VLFCEGFAGSSALARKVVLLYRLAGEQLSHQVG
jgi:hypothetical protein